MKHKRNSSIEKIHYFISKPVYSDARIIMALEWQWKYYRKPNIKFSTVKLCTHYNFLARTEKKLIMNSF